MNKHQVIDKKKVFVNPNSNSIRTNILLESNNKLTKQLVTKINDDDKLLLLKLQNRIDAQKVISTLSNFFNLKNITIDPLLDKTTINEIDFNPILLEKKQLTMTYCYNFIDKIASNFENKVLARKKFIIIRFCIDEIKAKMTIGHLISFFKNELLNKFLLCIFTSDIKFDYLRIESDDGSLDTGKIVLDNYYGKLNSEVYKTSIIPYRFGIKTINKYVFKKKLQFLQLYGLPEILKENDNNLNTNTNLKINLENFKKIFTDYFYCIIENKNNKHEEYSNNYYLKSIYHRWDKIAPKLEAEPLFRLKSTGIHRKILLINIDTNKIKCEQCIGQGFYVKK